MADRWYYLGPPVWYVEPKPLDSHWGMPAGCKGWIDLRSIPQQSLSGGSPEGLGLFALDHVLADPDYDLISRTTDEPVGAVKRTRMGSRLGRQVTQPRLDQILYELLTVRADPTGDTFARPLIPTISRELDIHLDGRIFRKPWRHDLTEMSAMMEQTREQYRTDRQLSLDGFMAPNHYRRILDARREKYRIDWRLLKPSNLPDEEPLPHRTTVTDNFNRADEFLQASADWSAISDRIAIVSNIIVHSQNSGVYRNENDLSSDDHSAKADYNGNGDTTGDRKGRLIARFDPTTTNTGNRNLYQLGLQLEIDDVILAKFVNGSPTTLDTNTADAYDDSTTYSVECEPNGSTIRGLIDSVQKVIKTDTAITGHVRHGLAMDTDGDSNSFLDNYEAADLAAAITAAEIAAARIIAYSSEATHQRRGQVIPV